MLESRTSWWKSGLTLDLRSVSLFRILLAVCLLIDLTNRLRGFEALYTDAGVLPRNVVDFAGEQDYWWSLYYFTGSKLGVGILFGLSYLAAILLLVGKWTRIVTFAAWILWLSLQNRNDFVIDGSDNIIRYFLLWANFVPWAAYFSLDSRKRKVGEGNQLFSVGSVIFVLQFILVYFFTGLWKCGPSWHEEGTAIYQAVSVDIFARNFGHWVQSWPHWALIAMAKMVWYVEVFGPFLVLIPWRNAMWRWIALAMFMVLQIGLALSFRLGHFPIVSTVMLVFLIPTSFWVKIGFEQGRQFHFTTGNPLIRKLGMALGGSLAAIAFFMNVVTFYESPVKVDGLKHFAEALRIDQKWSMFGPDPFPDDGWFVIPAQLGDSTEWDMMPFVMFGAEPKPVSLEKPALVHTQFGSARWQGFMGSLWLLKYSEHRPFLLEYIERKWAKEHPDRAPIVRINLVYMLEKTEKWTELAPEMVVLWRRTAGEPLYNEF